MLSVAEIVLILESPLGPLDPDLHGLADVAKRVDFERVNEERGRISAIYARLRKDPTLTYTEASLYAREVWLDAFLDAFAGDE